MSSSDDFDLFAAIFETLDLLELVVQQCRGKKNNLRLSCSRLRAVVDACVTSSTWARFAPLTNVSEHMAVLARCPRLQTLDFNGRPVADLSPMTSCIGLRRVTGLHAYLGRNLASFAMLTHLEHLDCSHCAGLSDIYALTACTALKYLDCSHTRIKQLPPLPCLETLICQATPLSDISVLIGCTSLKHLDFRGGRIIPPLPASLETLNISGIGGLRCLNLSSLAACPGLRSLDCSHTSVKDLSPLAACVWLRLLDCSHTPVRNLLPLLACMRLEVLECPDFDGVDEHTSLLLQAWPELNITVNMSYDGSEDEGGDDWDGDGEDDDGEDYIGDSMSDGDSD